MDLGKPWSFRWGGDAATALLNLSRPGPSFCRRGLWLSLYRRAVSRIVEHEATGGKTGSSRGKILPSSLARVAARGRSVWNLTVDWHFGLSFHRQVRLGRCALECIDDFIGHGAGGNTGNERREDLRFLLCPFLWGRFYRRLGHTFVTGLSSSAPSISHRTEQSPVRVAGLFHLQT
jgi:hypothetical protein